MGLVTCEKCKKIYDYEKYNGICPKCARYNRESTSVAEHQAYHDKYDGGYSHTAQDDHHSYHQRYDDNKNPHSGMKKTDKRTKIFLGIFFGVIAINVLLSGGFLLLPVIIGLVVYLKRKKK
jgi:predicted ATP-dependent serine protease